VIAGFQGLWADPRLRPLVFMTSNNFFGAFFGALYTLYGLKTLGLTPALLGITVAAGGLGGLAGAMLVGPLSRALGVGRAILAGAGGWAVAVLLIPLAPADPVWGTVVLCIGQFGGDLLASAGLILAVTLRQSILPPAMLGRVAATYQAMIGGAAILGALAGGLLGGAIGPRAALTIAALGLFIAPAIGFFSPLRQVKEMPQAPTLGG
jgi:MFS family permease